MAANEQKGVFEHVDPAIRFPENERAIGEFWKREKVFEKTLERPSPKGSFVFYEGPPTANGTPHNGHVLTRVVKDLFPRYKSMRGFHVGRKAGWDTHGLPVEVEVEKELRIHGKAAIEQFGVEPFVRRCIDSVFRYTHEWERLTDRIAFWCDLDHAYVTYHKSYVESVWWALSQLLEKGLLYRGHKVVWWWAQGGTALSSAEVGLGYKTVDDPSCFVRFPLVDHVPGQPKDLEGLALAAWTTTPWTLPSNMYAAVKADARYVAVQTAQGPVLIAEPLAADFAKKVKGAVLDDFHVLGSDLDGLRYRPPFDLYAKDHADDRAGGEAAYWRVIVETFVELTSGTGIVHVAPAFGEDDSKAFARLQSRLATTLELFCAVLPDGTFKPELAPYAGKWVKDADKDILTELKARHLLLHQELYRHDYPYCWRADEDPLIQFARPAWFIRTTSKKDAALEDNRAVNWLPSHIKEGRMGNFLENNVDWALSRERFWGTPLNVWVCEKDASHLTAPASVHEIEALDPKAFDHFRAAQEKDPSLNPHLVVHKPWIDQVTIPCKHCGATAKRVPEVIDCWFDSGCMPFAQWGFPHQAGSIDELREAWPADFISEAIDQTRGWFYSLLMISTLVFDDEMRAKFSLDRDSVAHPYKTCIVLGHVGDREGKKESKSKGNYTPPEVILDRVRMEFAVVDPSDVVGDRTGECLYAEPGIAWIGRDDFEGLDLHAGERKVHSHGETAFGTTLRVYREGLPEKRILVVPTRLLPRRVIALHPHDRAALAVATYSKGLQDVKPVEVPRYPPDQKVFVEDTSTPAPGADAFRWFFYAASPPWTNTRHSLSNVRALQKDFAIKLRNVYSFFTIYANLDGFDPRVHFRRSAKSLPSALDRWILGELALTVREVTARMDAYEIYESTSALVGLVESISNWYVRRSRDRFWASGHAADNADKRDAYGTLYEVLVTVAKLAAPFVPFLAEEIYRGLVGKVYPHEPCSVHLCDFPGADVDAIDVTLSREMADARAVVSLGLQVRTSSKLKVRQPLAVATVVVSSAQRDALQKHDAVIREELNVHAVKYVLPHEAEQFVTFKLKPNFRALGPRIGKDVQAVKKALETADAGALRADLAVKGRATIPGVVIQGGALEVGPEEIEVQVLAREGFAAAGDRVGVVVLDTRITQELKREGLAREVVNRLQTIRKEIGLAYDARVTIVIHATEELAEAVRAHRDRIAGDVLCTALELVDAPPPNGKRIEVEGATITVAMSPA